MATEKDITLGKFITPADAFHRGIENAASLEQAWAEIGVSIGYLKPDGWRFQIHVVMGNVSLFSREGKDWSSRFPNLITNLHETLMSSTMILDTELVGYDKNGRPASSSGILSASKHVCIVLDGLILNDEIVAEIPVEKRIRKLHRMLANRLSSTLKLASYQLIDAKGKLISLYQEFLRERKHGYDGVILKKSGTNYFSNAYKLKSEITVDLVVLGGYLNKDSELRALLLAVFDSQTSTWVPVGKISETGSLWEEVCTVCVEQSTESGFLNVIPPPAPPSFWIRPSIVVQVSARSIGLGAHGSYILRVDAPRHIFLRQDKGLETANTFDQLLEIAGISERPPVSGGLFSKQE